MTAVEPDTSVGSPIESGSRSGLAPNTPDSYTSWSSGDTVRCARLQTMFGRPTPTKQTRSAARVRALATIMISFFGTRITRSLRSATVVTGCLELVSTRKPE